MNQNIMASCSRLLTVLCCLSLFSLNTFAEEEQPKPKESELKKLTEKLKLQEVKPDRQKSIKLPEGDLGNRLSVDPIIKEMQRASKLIADQKTAKEAQQVQQQVVKDLEDLIRQVVESSPQNSLQQPRPDSQQQQDQQRQQKKKNGQQGTGSQQTGNQLSQGPARQSTDRQNKGKVTSGQLSDRNAYIKDAWGHLPPAMRQQLLNIYTEKFLPQYEEQVRRYYEALAEKNKQTP